MGGLVLRNLCMEPLCLLLAGLGGRIGKGCSQLPGVHAAASCTLIWWDPRDEERVSRYESTMGIKHLRNAFLFSKLSIFFFGDLKAISDFFRVFLFYP